MEKIGILVVTYNRKECLDKCLKHLFLLNECEEFEIEIFVVDNCSTDGTKLFLNEICKKKKNISVLYNDENIGGAGGFSRGISFAFDHGVDYVWGLDDDAYVSENALVEIWNAYKRKSELACMWSNCDEDKNFVVDVKEVNTWMFVGFFLPKAIMETVGLPREDFFIYHDDQEYAKRILLNGYKIYKVRDSYISHKDAAHQRPKLSRKVLFHKIELFDYPDWKLYYYIRNVILMYSYKEKMKYRLIFLTMPRYLLKLLCLKPQQLGVFTRAFLHGVLGKGGKCIQP